MGVSARNECVTLYVFVLGLPLCLNTNDQSILYHVYTRIEPFPLLTKDSVASLVFNRSTAMGLGS